MFPRPSRYIRLALFISAWVLCVVVYILFPETSIQQELHLITESSQYSRKTDADRQVHMITKRHNLRQSFNNPISKTLDNITDELKAYSFGLRIKSMLSRLQPNMDQNNKHVDTPIRPNEKDNIVNPHDFRYLNNPSSICKQVTPPLLLIYIHSSPGNLKRRQFLRQSWGHSKLLSLYNASMVFILGYANEKMQVMVDLEASEYGDIVQEDFIDSYKNLTHKGVAALKWVTNYCPDAQFLLKSDDDMLVDLVALMGHVMGEEVPRRGRSKLVLCNVWTKMVVMRDTKSKWYISKADFTLDYFPTYCSGSAFLLSGDLAPPLYATALRTPFFWVDDYYITGQLVNALGVKHSFFNKAYFLDYSHAEERLRNDSTILKVIHVKKLPKMVALWPRLVERHLGMREFLANHFRFVLLTSESNDSDQKDADGYITADEVPSNKNGTGVRDTINRNVGSVILNPQTRSLSNSRQVRGSVDRNGSVYGNNIAQRNIETNVDKTEHRNNVYIGVEKKKAISNKTSTVLYRKHAIRYLEQVKSSKYNDVIGGHSNQRNNQRSRSIPVI